MRGERFVVLAPNWLGDAVLALPAIDAVRQAHPASRLAVAARGPVADLFRLARGVDEVLPLQSDARWWRRTAFRADADALRSFDTALVLPNSFVSAWLVTSAAIPERWGYASDGRSRLLTRAVPRTRGGHQADYYGRLVTELGMPPPAAVPQVEVPDSVRSAALDLLEAEGYRRGQALAVLAPGAAYGTAKQWPPARVSALIDTLVRERGVACALVGSKADRAAARAVRGALRDPAARHVIDLTGRTSIEMLAGVLAACSACVCNDSGAMHLAAAVGAPVVATFGPTNERATGPLARPGCRAHVIAHDVWCRPCMLRECPIDHRCMRGLAPDRVLAVLESLSVPLRRPGGGGP